MPVILVQTLEIAKAYLPRLVKEMKRRTNSRRSKSGKLLDCCLMPRRKLRLMH